MSEVEYLIDDKPRIRKRRRKQCWLFCYFVLVASSWACVTSFQPRSSPRVPSLHCSAATLSTFALYSTTSTTTTSTSTTTSSSSSSNLQSRTVKELRQMIKDSPSAERGVLSRLKRKQDLIDYLLDNKQFSATIQKEESNGRMDKASAKANASQRQQQKRKQPLSLPPLVADVDHINGDDNHGSSAAAAAAAATTTTTTTSKTKTATISPKDAIFEQVYQRYPPVRDDVMAADNNNNNLSTSPEQDIRQIYHPILRHNSNTTSDMDIVFVGTASCTPGITRGVSCTALRLNWKRRAAFVVDPTISSSSLSSLSSAAAAGGHHHHHQQEQQQQVVNNFQGGTWLFDVGECTQLQIQRTSAIRPSKITKIFLTHAHGDHSFGLPGLLCLMGQDRDRETAPPVEIYGPEGLRMWLRVAIRYSVSRIVPPYRVHEIMHVPMAPEWEFNGRARRFYYRGRKNARPWGQQGLAGEDPTNWISQANRMHLEPSPLYGEIEGGRDIYPVYNHPLSADGAPVWEVEDEEDVKVYAAPMSHGIPCLGYVVEECTRPGRLRNEYVEPIVRRNVDALKEAGFKVPMKAMAVIKNLQPGSAFTFPDGTVVTQEDAVEPPRKGRKVVYCGDTADCRALVNLARDADVIIHECTNSYLQGVDKDTNLRAVTRDAIVHGHSTPQIAGDFCRKANGQRLLLNHFSARYKGDISVDSLSIMMRIEKQAMKAANLKETQVAAAWDLMCLPIPCH